MWFCIIFCLSVCIKSWTAYRNMYNVLVLPLVFFPKIFVGCCCCSFVFNHVFYLSCLFNPSRYIHSLNIPTQLHIHHEYAKFESILTAKWDECRNVSTWKKKYTVKLLHSFSGSCFKRHEKPFVFFWFNRKKFTGIFSKANFYEFRSSCHFPLSFRLDPTWMESTQQHKCQLWNRLFLKMCKLLVIGHKRQRVYRLEMIFYFFLFWCNALDTFTHKFGKGYKNGNFFFFIERTEIVYAAMNI